MPTPLNIIGGFYADEAKPWMQQDICNYIPFLAEQPGTLSPVKAVDAPGLKPSVEIASDGGVRGAKNVEGKLLVVAGSELYQISNTGVAIPRGTIPGTGLVSIDYNQRGIANEVLIGNGSAGYVYNTATLTLERITDEAFPGTKAVAYLDSYLLGVEPLGRFWFHSDLANASSYNSLDRYEAETAPDRIVTLAVSNEEVVVFGQTTTDFFVNTGEATGTFQSKGVSMDVGCASAASVVKLDNTLFWLDNYGVFQRLNGYSPQPVSTRVIESAISGFDWAKCRATVYQDKGRKIVYWTFPRGLTLGYDVTTGLWHRREAYGMTTDRISTITFWNRKWIAGDYASGRLYELDWDYMLQVDQPHVRKLKTAPLTADRNRLTLHMAELVFDTGGPETVAIPFPEQPDPPTISGAAPDGQIGTAYAGYAYTVAGTGALTVTLRSGTLPPGVTISTAGVLSATNPLDSGTYTFTLRVTDSTGLYAELTDTVVIAAVQYATSIGSDLSYTSDLYDWDVTVNVGESVSQRLVESRNGKVFVFHSDDSGGAVSSNAGVSWTACTGLPASLRIVALVFADDTYIAVPASGTDLYVSTDGIAFTAREFATDDQVISCAWANGDTVIIARSNSSQSRRSLDGGTVWADCPLVSAVQVWAIANDEDVLVAASEANLQRSTDRGATWATIPSEGGAASVAFNGDLFMVMESSGATRTSPTGVTWTAATALSEGMGGVGQGNEMVFDGDNFVVAGATHLWTSPDAAAWTQRTALAATAIAFYRMGQ